MSVENDVDEMADLVSALVDFFKEKEVSPGEAAAAMIGLLYTLKNDGHITIDFEEILSEGSPPRDKEGMN